MKGLSEESLEREKMRERGTARVRVRETANKKEKGERETERAAGVTGPQAMTG